MRFFEDYFSNVEYISKNINISSIKNIVNVLEYTRDVSKGRVFVLGIGGSAGNASHFVNDLRKLCNIEAYAPTDNVSEITARTNDDGFETIFQNYLKISKLNSSDVIFILSVGGGSIERNVSVNLIDAIKYAKEVDACVISILGKDDGYAATNSHYSLIVPNKNSSLITPLSESFQSVIWHSIISHPKLQTKKPTW